ncbi:deoxyribonuclease-like protein tatD [Amylocarpus encephaloides]|uniref:Deoxyribonuclease-like protein tatD n=1 Tax=Amylocarpus encephaloides TaxID=45428 RepID=A0A9P7YP07_9HELO|nr:deoxyribonuclease-like protein tatD [Amylocarpus encephaloides]
MATPSPPPAAAQPYQPRYIDIGINLTDPVYSGLYHGTQRHAADLASVVQRAKDAGCMKLIVTGSDLAESEKALELAEQYPGTIYTTIGVHPCSSLQFTQHEAGAQELLDKLKHLALASRAEGHCVAFGEIGLDYDRLALCPKDVQLRYFAAQLDIAVQVNLPLFLHSRAAHADFLALLSKHADNLPKKGVVHSFTGTMAEMQDLVAAGWSIGVNGCSLKTAENLEVVKQIPIDRLMLETDGPWCEIRPSHASAAHLGGWEEGRKWVKKEKFVEGALVKGRNESCMVRKVAWVVAGVRGESLEVVCEKVWGNTVRMFGLGEEGN